MKRHDLPPTVAGNLIATGIAPGEKTAFGNKLSFAYNNSARSYVLDPEGQPANSGRVTGIQRVE
jgi:hypothetical protein